MAWRQGLNELLSILLPQPPQQMGKQRYIYLPIESGYHFGKLSSEFMKLNSKELHTVSSTWKCILYTWLPMLNNSRGGARFPSKHMLNLSSKLCFKNHKAVVQAQLNWWQNWWLWAAPTCSSSSQQASPGFWEIGQINPISFCKSVTWLVDQRIAISHTLSWF